MKQMSNWHTSMCSWSLAMEKNCGQAQKKELMKMDDLKIYVKKQCNAKDIRDDTLVMFHLWIEKIDNCVDTKGKRPVLQLAK